jgi:SAM-dependent methyltransferase
MNYLPSRYLFRLYEILRRVRPGYSFLEVGPGRLDLARTFLGRFERGTLVDFSPDVQFYYDALPEEQRKRLSLLIADFQTIMFDNQFDCFVACEVLEHVQDDAAFLQSAYTLLKKGGQLILSVPARMKYWSRHDEAVGHCRRYEREQLFTLLQQTSYGDIEIIAYGFPFVNLLRIPRIWLANWQYRKMAQWSQKKRTQESGVNQIPPSLKYLALISNPYTVYPLAALASLFNAYDLSEAYLVTAVAK